MSIAIGIFETVQQVAGMADSEAIRSALDGVGEPFARRWLAKISDSGVTRRHPDPALRALKG